MLLLRPFTVVLLFFISIVVVCAKPSLSLENDKLPGGHSTPEGVAADLSRAYITCSDKLLLTTSVAPFGGALDQKKYKSYIDQQIKLIAKAANKPGQNLPQIIAKVFAARRFPGSQDIVKKYASFGFKDIKFVDIGLILRNGHRSLERTLVIEKSDGKWYADPAPQLISGMSDILNVQPKSTIDFSKVYSISK
jgi:hypothetical protein